MIFLYRLDSSTNWHFVQTQDILVFMKFSLMFDQFAKIWQIILFVISLGIVVFLDIHVITIQLLQYITILKCRTDTTTICCNDTTNSIICLILANLPKFAKHQLDFLKTLLALRQSFCKSWCLRPNHVLYK